MKKQRMNPETQLKGVLKAIDSPKTPPHLKAALARRAVELKKQSEKKKSPGLLARFGL
jgi:hypothetical protein